MSTRTSARLRKRQERPQDSAGAGGGDADGAAPAAAPQAAAKRSKRQDRATADEAAAEAPTRGVRRGRGLRRADTVHVYAGHSETGEAAYENAEDAELVDGEHEEDGKAQPKPSVKRKTTTKDTIQTSGSEAKRGKNGSCAASAAGASADPAMGVATGAGTKPLRQQSTKPKTTGSKKAAKADVPPPLTDHPFYGNPADAPVHEQDPTYSVREPVRAMMHGNLQLLKTLADSPFLSSLHVPANGLTALHHAVRLNNLEAIKFLVEDLFAGKPRPQGRKP